jgi:fused signal recognition particle receptor
VLPVPSMNEIINYWPYLSIPLILLVIVFFKKKKTTVIAEPKAETPIVPQAPVKKEIPWTERLKGGLSRSRSEVWGKLSNLFTGGALPLDEIEELLYSSDLGPKTVQELIANLEQRNDLTDPSKFKDYLFTFLKEKIKGIQEQVDLSLIKFDPNAPKGLPKVIMIVGVNGAGKTTTIGKLAMKLTSQGAKVVVGAGDTFRAAAVDQLEVWCNKANAEILRAKEGSSPSGVAYGALERAINVKADYCILDTAGRLHNKENLMEELKKSKDVLKKLDPTAPQHVILVIDAVSGQNAIRQAEEFNKYLALTGLIFTKCDGSSKAGAAVPIIQGLKVPIVYIGVGEGVEDLNAFFLDDYLKALLGL